MRTVHGKINFEGVALYRVACAVNLFVTKTRIDTKNFLSNNTRCIHV